MPDLGVGLIVAGSLYALALLGIAVSSHRRKKGRLSDFFLADRSLGLGILLLTLFATQYSGNSLSGFPGQTYREGLAYYMSVTFMVSIVGGYLLFAPRLYRASRQGGFVTPADYLEHRYGSRGLHATATAIWTLTLVNFLLAQLMALGHAFAGLTGDRIPYAVGVIVGAAVILAYEMAGGMRAVAWTDAVQGVILVLGLLLAALLLVAEVGTPAELVRAIRVAAPEKAAAPSLAVCNLWLSNFLLLGLGAPLYPQAIQRIYAARRLTDLRRALIGMAFLPHLAITTVVLVGIAGIVLFPRLSATEADQVTFLVLARLVELEPLAYLPVLLVMLAVLAAIMSTADSCLLSLSSILTKDLFARWRGLAGQAAEGLTRASAVSSFAVMAILVPVALRPLTTLWDLLVIKFEILIQLSPAFVLGTWHEDEDPRRVQAREILAGLAVGLVIALGLALTGYRSVGGFHAGTVGVAANYVTVLTARALRIRSARW